MNNLKAFLCSLLITLILGGVYYGVHSAREEVIITRVLDGDTVELDDGRRVRLLNINALEKGQPHAEEATQFLAQYENKTIELEVAGQETYGRFLGRLYSLEDDYLNLQLVEEGLVHKRLVSEDELKLFTKAEEQARAQGKGIWQHSQYWNCVSAAIDPKAEVVLIKNACSVSMTGWTMKDASTNTYVFKHGTAPEIYVYSAEGTDEHTTYYWGRGNAWNNDEDEIFIRDTNGLLVYYDAYP